MKKIVIIFLLFVANTITAQDNNIEVLKAKMATLEYHEVSQLTGYIITSKEDYIEGVSITKKYYISTKKITLTIGGVDAVYLEMGHWGKDGKDQAIMTYNNLKKFQKAIKKMKELIKKDEKLNKKPKKGEALVPIGGSLNQTYHVTGGLTLKARSHQMPVIDGKNEINTNWSMTLKNGKTQYLKNISILEDLLKKMLKFK